MFKNIHAILLIILIYCSTVYAQTANQTHISSKHNLKFVYPVKYIVEDTKCQEKLQDISMLVIDDDNTFYLAPEREIDFDRADNVSNCVTKSVTLEQVKNQHMTSWKITIYRDVAENRILESIY